MIIKLSTYLFSLYVFKKVGNEVKKFQGACDIYFKERVFLAPLLKSGLHIKTSGELFFKGNVDWCNGIRISI